ncbi:hypothetical protein V2J09_014501 [Rumex salicifolius]
MSPKSLSIFPAAPLSFPSQFKSSIFHPPLRPLCPPSHKFTLITCRATPFHESPTHFPVSGFVPEKTGAAAPTRGEVFLEHHQSKVASKIVLASVKKKKKKEDKKEPFKVFDSAVASCYGCGAPLQTQEVDGPGYVDTPTYELVWTLSTNLLFRKKKHRQLRTVLCGRCRLLSHGHMITAVGGHGGYSGGKEFVTAEQLREKLSHLRHQKALIVKLVDIVDFNGSFLSRVRDLVGANPIILVITKIDLLPKGTDFNCVGDWVVEATTRKKLNVLSVHLTSSKSLVGIAGVVSEIQKEKKGRDAYILGAANVGKSAFINAILMMLGQKDPVAAAAQKYKPIQSAVPGTTLGPIPIEAFLGGGKLFDTPGVHLHHRQAAVIQSEDLPSLAPRSRIRGQSFPKSLLTCKTEAEKRSCFHGMNGFSIFWGGLVRVDILKVHPATRLTFFGPKALQIHIVPTEEADAFYKKELGNLLTPPSGNQLTEWDGLEIEQKLQLKFEESDRPTCDVAISGLGWISVEPISKLVKKQYFDAVTDESSNELHLSVSVPKPVQVFVRTPLPVGKAGAEWYEYRDLTEEEEEIRPKWYF